MSQYLGEKSYFSFQWHITDECDQRCKHCYIFSGEGCRELKSMTYKQMQEVIANCEDFCKVYNWIPYFYITGGDPILHPDFWKLMVLLKSKNIPFTLMGNPFHLDDEICRMLKVCGCEKYQMSLDGMEKTHDWFRKMENMILQATELGIASCIISRGYETFDSEEGRNLMKEWKVPEGYACQGFVILGYIDGEQPHHKPRKPGRIKIIETQN